MKMDVKETLKNIYLEYANDYLTVAKMAEHNNIAEQDMKMLIEMGRYYYNNKHFY